MLPADLHRIATLEAELAQLRQRFDRLAPTDDDRPWMKLTAKGTGADADNYAWTEAAHDADGEFYDRPGGRSGVVNGVAGSTVTWSPAREMNGATVSSFPYYARAERSVVTSEGPVYYFSAAEAGAGDAKDTYSVGVADSPITLGSGGSAFRLDVLSTDETGWHFIVGAFRAILLMPTSGLNTYASVGWLQGTTGTATPQTPVEFYGVGAGYGGSIAVCTSVLVTVAPASISLLVQCTGGPSGVNLYGGATLFKS